LSSEKSPASDDAAWLIYVEMLCAIFPIREVGLAKLRVPLKLEIERSSS
jgi:hypothetical protein